MPHPEEIRTENLVCFCSGSVKLQTRENGVFFTPVKYTLFCRAPRVSWVARHTTMYLHGRDASTTATTTLMVTTNVKIADNNEADYLCVQGFILSADTVYRLTVIGE